MYIYIASPLCCECEKSFNLKLNDFVKSFGYKTYLPQLDGGVMTDFVNQGMEENKIREKLFELDVSKMNDCDCILINLDGRTIDEGACFELGYMYSLKKTCFGFKTDSRSFIRGKNNLMIDGALETILYDWEELKLYLTNINKKT
ncbi:MAG: nucleoside 2-deoxyribosyltransferase [Bacteroidia bacterium]|nr:nucleoside 2-deoxyribosyltransferase [Bacteroidia bacterium]